MAALTSIAVGVGLAATAAGGAMQFVGQRQQAKAATAAAEFNAKVQENEAIRVQQESAEQTKRTRIANKRLSGRQRAQIGKAGVIESGSPLELMAETAGELELGVLDGIRTAQARQEQLRSQAGLTRFEGQMKAKGLRRQAMGSLIKTAGQIGFGVAGAKQQGLFKGTPSSGGSGLKLPSSSTSFIKKSGKMARKNFGTGNYSKFY